MSEANKAVAARFFDEVCNGRKLEVADELFSPSHIHHDPAHPETAAGPEGIKQLLGLYHTSEADGGAFDPITDTPTCACDVCAPAADRVLCTAGSGTVTGPDCLRSLSSCGGGRNLMFWLLGSVSTGRISPEQSRIVRANPLVR